MRNFTWFGVALAFAGVVAGCSQQTFVVKGTTADLEADGEVRVLWGVDESTLEIEDPEERELRHFVIDGEGSAADGRFTLVLDEEPPQDAKLGGGVAWGDIYLFPADVDLPERGTIVTEELLDLAVATDRGDLVMWLVDDDPEPGSSWDEGYNCLDESDPEAEAIDECGDLVLSPITR